MTWILKTHAGNSFCQIFGGILVQMNDFTLLKVEHMPLGKHLLATGAKTQGHDWSKVHVLLPAMC